MLNKKITAVAISSVLLLSSCSLKIPKDRDQVQVSVTPAETEQVQDNQKPVITPTPTPALEKPPVQNVDNIEPSTAPVSSDNVKRGWGYRTNSEHKTPEIPVEFQNLLNKYSSFYVGDTSSKVIYMTFDEGYENGYTGKILDILKANGVKAAFFVTRPYIKQNPELIKRMIQEGHIVGNHTSHHPSMPSKTGDEAAFNKEFTDVEALFKEVTGNEMPKFFRPPMGEFSEKSLEMTQKLGYYTIFWSFAHKDWLVDNQPTVQAAHDKILKHAHNGEIMLLHAVSKSNTEALDSVIKDLEAQGYRFAGLEELKR
jgi:peptidoglycan-N-acetylmuramic acid deacetylase